jgi:DNA-binding NtrC family response regulator
VRLLAEHFWNAALPGGAPISEELVARFESYTWPGNVRELYNAVLHHATLGDLAEVGGSRGSIPPSELTPESRRDVVDDVIARGLPFPRARQKVLEDFEERYVDAMLKRHDDNISKAAAAAGIARRYFYTIRTRRGR